MINHRIVTALSLSLLISVPVTKAMQSNNAEQQRVDVGGYVGQDVEEYQAFLNEVATVTGAPIPAATDVASTGTENFFDAVEVGSQDAESQPASITSNASQAPAQRPASLPAPPFAPVQENVDTHSDNNAERSAISPVVSEGSAVSSNHQQNAPAAYEQADPAVAARVAEAAEQLQQEEITFEVGSEDAESVTDTGSIVTAASQQQPASMTSNAPQTAPAVAPGQPVSAASTPVAEQQAPAQPQAPAEGLLARGVNLVREHIANSAAIVRQNPGRTIAATAAAIAAVELARRGVNYLRSNNAAVITIQLRDNATISFAPDGGYTCNNAALGIEIEQAFTKVRRTQPNTARARLALPQDNFRLIMVREQDALHIGLFYKGEGLQAVEQGGQLLTTVISNNRLSPENSAILNRIAAISRNEQPSA